VSWDHFTHYDPKIVVQFSASPQDFNNWGRFGEISVPMHVTAGGMSDILTTGILERMGQSQPSLGLTMFDDFGHAPSLSRPEDYALVRRIIEDMSGS